MSNYTPKHLRRGGAARNGSVGIEKKMAFRKVKMMSDKFIHQSASRLEKGDIREHYRLWCDKADRQALRA